MEADRSRRLPRTVKWSLACGVAEPTSLRHGSATSSLTFLLGSERSVRLADKSGHEHSVRRNVRLSQVFRDDKLPVRGDREAVMEAAETRKPPVFVTSVRLLCRLVWWHDDVSTRETANQLAERDNLMNSVKKKILLAVGIFWCGVALSIVIPSYGTHAGPRHPNPSIVIIMLPLMVAGLTGAFKLAKSMAFIVLQIASGLILVAVVFAMDQRAIGPNWPACTCTLAAFLLGVISMVGTSLLDIREQNREVTTSGSESTDS